MVLFDFMKILCFNIFKKMILYIYFFTHFLIYTSEDLKPHPVRVLWFEDLKWDKITIFIYTNYITILVMISKICYNFSTITS